MRTRAQQALAAGCDILLVCNNPDGADEVLESLRDYSSPATQLRMIRLHGQECACATFHSSEWQSACDKLAQFNQRLGLAEGGDLFE